MSPKLLLFLLPLLVPLAYRVWPRIRFHLSASWVRHRFEPGRYGLVPSAQLDARRAGPPLSGDRAEQVAAVVAAAHRGEWRELAAHVRAAGKDWDERWARQELLAQLADGEPGKGGDGRWLTRWLEDAPEDGTAATVHAQVLAERAWGVRGSGVGEAVSANRMARFRVELQAAFDAARAAAELSPEDPGPWVVMVGAARGLTYEHEEFHRLWQGLVDRAPHHFEGHSQALQYWCAKWHGTERLMTYFAELALHNAPAGSPLAGIYLYALAERIEQRPAPVPQLDAVAASLALVDAADRRLPHLRHLLAHRLLEAGRYDAALEQFRLVGRWCGARPWTDEGDPAAAFDLARGRAALRSRDSRAAGEREEALT